MASPSIMIVEDDPVSAQLIVLSAQALGCTSITIHEDGLSALRAFLASACDIVIIDISLIGSMDGIQLARQIRKHAHTRVIFVSAYATDEVFKEALPLLPAAYLVKPVKSADLKAAILLAGHTQKRPSTAPLEDEWIALSGGCRYNRRHKRFETYNIPVDLSNLEHRLVELLAESIGNCVSYEQILSSLWHDSNTSVDSLRSLVRRLHRKVGHPLINNLYSKGYMIPRPEFSLSYQI